ncbi:hypothetical protein SAY87_023786 [Trapa incisa]|uniref:Pectinesterase inhibitor domain-containing protein n=1 Tax=Trapa incisa TaxID=236973 RepID=A0AAN7L674_9MYRT|nr:hypothetical protein SAY87_023786 [Trapa incisa]
MDMASPIKSYVVNCFFLIALLLLCPPSLATADDFSSAMCSGTLDPIFCFQVLKTIPGAGQAAGLESLEGTVISFSLSKGNEIHEYVQSLAGAKDVYSNCAKIYGEFMGRLQNAQGMLKSKDYKGVLNMASNCINGVAACSDSLKDVPIPSYSSASGFSFQGVTEAKHQEAVTGEPERMW